MADIGERFRFANTDYPLQAQAAGADLLPVCDPTVAKLLDFFSSVLTTHIGAALSGASAGVAPIAATVGAAIPMNPSEVSKVEQLFNGSPLLAVWRRSSTKTDHTGNWRRSVWRFGAAYILPPLSAGQATKLYPILNAVDQILTQRVHQGFDPSYNNGERVFDDAEISGCLVIASEIGRWDTVGDSIDFHGWFGDLQVSEQEMPTTLDLPPFTGTDGQITDESVQENYPIDVAQPKVP